ncbi:MAG: DUF4140 domain-containing protein, partial [Luteibaculum sp.]
MKNFGKGFILLVSALGMFSSAHAQLLDTLKINGKVDEVTVYPTGAAIAKKITFTALPGKHVLQINNLPISLDPNTVQIGSDQSFKVLSVKS